jgi:thiamine transport system permease protein
LKYYAALFHNPAQSILYVAPSTAVVNSLLFALAAMCLALGLGWLAAAYLSGGRSGYGDLLDPVFMLPLSTSAVTLGFGFILALDEPPLNLRTSLMLPAVAHALVAFPFVLRSLLPAMRGIPQNLRDAAAMLGASPWQVWRYVDLPILTRALLVGAVFAAAVSLGEFGATVFTARPDTPTMPVAIFRLLGQPGAMNYGQAMAMSCLLMLTTAAAFLLLEGVKAKGRF